MGEAPLTNFHFQVDWEGERLGFTEVSGLSLEHEVISYRDGMSKDHTATKLPGLEKYGNIVLKRGLYLGDNEFTDWWATAGKGSYKRTVRVMQLSESHEPRVLWIIRNAWPVSLQLSRFHALHSEVLIERLELAHEGITIQHQ